MSRDSSKGSTATATDARAMYAAYGSSPGLRKSPVESATSPREMHERGGAATGMSPSANGRAFGTSPATPRTRAGRPSVVGCRERRPRLVGVAGESNGVESSVDANDEQRTGQGEDWIRGWRKEEGAVGGKPPIGMLRAELAGDFTCDVFDSDAHQRLMAAVPEVFAERPCVRLSVLPRSRTWVGSRTAFRSLH